MRYRPEIDGLRAVAVIPVILFHAGFEAFRGGFVGVDVFFVVSGYLITTIIATEIAEERFSIVRFYERRARRILPALFLVLAVSIPLALVWLLPTDMRSFSRNVRDVALFVSNFSLSRQVGYFDTAAELKPLLHTWSLAVEEQFYLFFPWLLLLGWKYVGARRVGLAVLGVAVVSFGVAEWSSRAGASATFFLPQSRLWELAVGALIALWRPSQRDHDASPVQATVAGVAGVLLILAAMLCYDEITPFPGVYALAPTVGTALIILFATPATLVGRLLGNKLLVGIGLISYSAYLWHQPLFAFVRQRSIEPPSAGSLLLMVALTMVLAYLSWRCVERPMRDKSRVSARAIGWFAGVGTLVLVAFGVAGSESRGFEQRAKWRLVAEELATKSQRGSGERYCREHRIQSSLGPLVCIIGNVNSEPEGVLWGDSFAGALLHGLNRELEASGRAYYAVLGVGCVPVEGAWRAQPREYGCTAGRHRKFVDTVLGMEQVTRIVWVGAFANLTGQPDFAYRERDYRLDALPATPELVKARVLGTLEKLAAAGKTIVLVGDTPRFPYDVSDFAIKKYFASGGDRSTGVQRVSRTRATEVMNEADMLSAARTHARVVDGLDAFCDREWCVSHDAAGRLLFVDNGHPSHLGSERLARAVMRQME